MPLYEFEAMDATGMEIKDEIESPTEEEAQATIRQMGYFVTKIRRITPKPDPDMPGDSSGIVLVLTREHLTYMAFLFAGFLAGLVVGLAIASTLAS